MPAASLSGATEGDLDRSIRQPNVRRPNGFGDELRCILTGPTGVWGSLTLLRELGRPDFTPAEVHFVASLAAPLADGVRAGDLLDGDAEHDDVGETGFLVVDPDNGVELANDAAARWLDELTVTAAPAIGLPVAVTVVAETRHVGERGATVATARVRTRRACGSSCADRWSVTTASPCSSRPPGPASTPRRSPMPTA